MQPGSNVFLLTRHDTLMPGVFAGAVHDNRGVLYAVVSPEGRTYRANPAHVFGYEQGRAMLRTRRAELLVQEGYQIMPLRGNRYHVWSPAQHGNEGGYVVTIGENGDYACNCPSAATVGPSDCKHALGAWDLLRYAQVQKPVVRVAAVTTETPEARRARFRARVERDFGYQGPIQVEPLFA